jgi:hypothetical protein
MTPASIDHVPGAVLVMEDGLVDGLCAVVEFVDKGFAQIVLIRPLGMVGDGYADASGRRVVLNVVGGKEEIVFTVLFGDGGGPHGFFRPADGVSVDDAFVLLPMDKVGRGEGVEKDLVFIFCGVGGVDPIKVAEYGGFGVGIPAGEDRVAGGLRMGWL